VSAGGTERTQLAGRVLVLGATGFLGANVVLALLEDPTVDAVVRHGRDLADVREPVRVQTVGGALDRPGSIERVIDSSGADLVVNCAALADVDRCEREPVLATRLNALLPERAARACDHLGVGLVHVSTDAVFDGRNGPYTTSSPVAPLSVYGRTKADGEEAVLAVLPDAIIARTNIVGWSPSGTRSLLEYFHGRLVRGEPAPGFTDLLFRPLPVHWFWPAVRALHAAGATGLCHVTGPELLSKYAFGRRVAGLCGADPDLVVATSGLVDRGAQRAPDLDVVPSRAAQVWGPSDGATALDRGLRELLTALDAGVRERLLAPHDAGTSGTT
jgi:dTDP-4-dehydrorhamnose reductase